MIYFIADTHGDIDRLKRLRLKKTDFLIICGDFGFIWNGDKKEKQLLKKIGRRRYPVLFIDGLHENFGLLSQFPVEEWNGGKTRIISGNLRYLMRGQVFDLNGEKVFTLGGGWSDDDDDVLGEENRALAVPDLADRDESFQNLEKHGNKVDFVASFEPPSKIAGFLSLSRNMREHAKTIADEVDKRVEFKRWFFGRYHLNKVIPPRYFAVYNKAVKSNIVLK